MKKLLFAVLLSAGFLGASAQKIGYINTDELIGSMPEAAKAQTELNEFQQSLTQQGQDMMRDLSAKDSIFVRDSVKYSASMKEIKRKELIDLYQKAQNFQQQEAQQLMQEETDNKVKPIREKALTAIRAVAKENNYAYVMEQGNLIVMPPGDDLLNLVRAKLGIKDTPSRTTTPASRPSSTPVKKP